ncbi:MAG: hypothetical protein N2484_12285 [Clostridia bacterium]|nr:hypothetical protein [Clostridia bacterium]
MSECICSSCRNLKGVLNDQGAVENYVCEFGFPSDTCEDCEENECDLTCSQYVCDEEEAAPVIVACSGCGKELKQVCGDGDEGEVYCFDCYLRKNM